MNPHQLLEAMNQDRQKTGSESIHTNEVTAKVVTAAIAPSRLSTGPVPKISKGKRSAPDEKPKPAKKPTAKKAAPKKAAPITPSEKAESGKYSPFRGHPAANVIDAFGYGDKEAK